MQEDTSIEIQLQIKSPDLRYLELGW